MFRNYLLVTFRNLFKNRVFALINIFGLGMALSICITAYFNHMFDVEFDGTHENKDEIYRINIFRDMQGRDQEYGIVPATLGLEIKKDIPGIKRAARFLRSYSPVKVEHDIFNQRIIYVDPEFLDIFTIPLISGNKKAIDNRGNIFISEKLSGVLFGDEDPTGRMVTIFNDDNEENVFTVAGVFENLPLNSSFRIDLLTHFDNFLRMWDIVDTDWKSWATGLFIQVGDPSILTSVEQSLEKYIPIQNKAREDFLITGFNLVPLKTVGDNSRNIWSQGLFPGLHPAAVTAPPIMAILILLIASFNYTNTAIASAGKRLKEIGIRRVAGGQKRQLMVQFLFENFIICFLALLVGISIANFLVPAYSSLWEYMFIELSFTKYLSFWAFLVLLLLLTGFLAGAYPALYVSSFKPVTIFQGKMKLGSSNSLSSILLALQFTISVMALISGVIFTKNATYQETLDLGYDRDKVIVVPIVDENFNIFREEIIKNPKITAVAGTQEHIGYGYYRRAIEDENQQIEVNIFDIGPEYIETMGLTLLDGRSFNEERKEFDRQGSILVNQKLVDYFGWKNPVGQHVRMNDTLQLTVTGVVKDFYTAGLWQAIDPTLLRLAREDIYYNMVVRAKPEDLEEIQEYLRETWMKLIPNYPYNGEFQEDTLQEEKNINKSIKEVNLFLAVVATILSLIGLYTLVSLSIINRIKEIGIRKILGATVITIMLKLSRNFFLILAIASTLGCIAGYYLSISMLDSI